MQQELGARPRRGWPALAEEDFHFPDGVSGGEDPTLKEDPTATPGSLSSAYPSGAAVCAWKAGTAWPVTASTCHTESVARVWASGGAAVGAAVRERREPMRPVKG